MRLEDHDVSWVKRLGEIEQEQKIKEEGRVGEGRMRGCDAVTEISQAARLNPEFVMTKQAIGSPGKLKYFLLFQFPRTSPADSVRLRRIIGILRMAV